MKLKRPLAWVCVLAAAGVFAAACGDDDSSSSATTSGGAATSAGGGASTSGGGAATTAAKADDYCTADRVGGEVKVHTQQAAVTLDPYTAAGGAGVTGWEMQAVYSMLMRFDSASGKFVPLVAKSLEPNADATVWTLTLRDGVTFGNGDPLDADAMVAHLDRHLSAASKSIIKGPNNVYIQSYKKTGPMAVEFDLKAPYGNFPYQLTTGLGMVQNVKVITAMGQEAFSKKPTGGGVGAWEIESWAPPEASVFKAKSNWWGGPVCIQTLTVSQLPGVTQAWDAFKKDELQVATFNREPVTMDEAKKAYPDSFATELGHGSFMVMPNAGAGGYTGPTTDPKVRLAIAYAIDADVINQRAFSGKGQPGKGIVAPGSKLLKATEGIPYDPTKAKQLLDEVKQARGWDGSIQTVCANQPAANLEACITVEAMLSAVGFKVTPNALPVGQMVASVLVDKKFEVVSSWGMIQSEITLYNGLVNIVDGRNPANHSGYKNAEMDAALDKLRAAQGVPAYQAALEDMQKLVNRDNPFITYAAGEQMTVYKPNIHGIVWQSGYTELLERAYIAK